MHEMLFIQHLMEVFRWEMSVEIRDCLPCYRRQIVRGDLCLTWTTEAVTSGGVTENVRRSISFYSVQILDLPNSDIAVQVVKLKSPRLGTAAEDVGSN